MIFILFAFIWSDIRLFNNNKKIVFFKIAISFRIYFRCQSSRTTQLCHLKPKEVGALLRGYTLLTAPVQAHPPSSQTAWASSVLSVCYKEEKRTTNIFWAERKEERGEMERGWVLCRVREAARIHYLRVLYLFHMLLLSNLSLQIMDSENKQMDQSTADATEEHCCSTP